MCTCHELLFLATSVKPICITLIFRILSMTEIFQPHLGFEQWLFNKKIKYCNTSIY